MALVFLAPVCFWQAVTHFGSLEAIQAFWFRRDSHVGSYDVANTAMLVARPPARSPLP